MGQLSHQSQNESPMSFADQAKAPTGGLASELVALLRQNKKWWLIPVIAALLVVGVMVVLGGTAAAPFIYTLF